jgi:hypothetical protein
MNYEPNTMPNKKKWYSSKCFDAAANWQGNLPGRGSKGVVEQLQPSD